MTEKVLMLNGLKEVVMSHLAKLLIFEKELKKKDRWTDPQTVKLGWSGFL